MPQDSSTDLTLMAALAAGRESALDELMERWESPLRSFAQRYLQNATDSDDVVEETFVRIQQRRASFQAGTNFSAWIFTIAANLCRHRLRWRRRHPTEPLETPGAEGDSAPRVVEIPDRGQDPAAAAEQAERIRALRSAVAALPHDQRTAFLLHAYENLSYREIANVLGCSERGVETRLYRARQVLRVQLAPIFRPGGPATGGTSPAPAPASSPPRTPGAPPTLAKVRGVAV